MRVLSELAEFATSLTFEDVPASVVDHAEHRLWDAVGCAIAGKDAAAARAADAIAPDGDGGGATGMLLRRPAMKPADSAAFINTACIRALDFNDAFPGGHASDMLGGLLAVAASRSATGRALLCAQVVAYEVFCRFSLAVHLKNRAIDQGLGMAIGVAAGLSNLLDLDRAEAAQAIAISAVAGVPLRATRAGELSDWKGAATAQAIRVATFSTLLAEQGVTGPRAPFTGRHGLGELLGIDIDLPPLPASGGEFILPRTRLKYWPVVYTAQPAVWSAIELAADFRPEECESIVVETDSYAVHESASEPAKWAPETRETADHSLPYIVAWALLNGTFDLDAFDGEPYRSAPLRSLMAKISVVADPAIDQDWPRDVATRITITDRSGNSRQSFVHNPPGHEGNAMTDEQVAAKFARLVSPTVGEQACQQLSEQWADIRAIADVGDAVARVARASGAGPL